MIRIKSQEYQTARIFALYIVNYDKMGARPGYEETLRHHLRLPSTRKGLLPVRLGASTWSTPWWIYWDFLLQNFLCRDSIFVAI